MSINPTQAPSTTMPPITTSSGSSTSNGVLNFTQNFNTFLTLLTTQLQNQDPLSPMDTNHSPINWSQFASVEQQINTNSNLQTLIAAPDGAEAISALPVVGQEIQYNGNQTVPLENGQAELLLHAAERRPRPPRWSSPTPTAMSSSPSRSDRSRDQNIHLERPDQRRPRRCPTAASTRCRWSPPRNKNAVTATVPVDRPRSAALRSMATRRRSPSARISRCR